MNSRDRVAGFEECRHIDCTLESAEVWVPVRRSLAVTFFLILSAIVAGCSKSDERTPDGCRPVAIAPGARVVYLGEKGLSIPNFPLHRYDYFGELVSVVGDQHTIKWDHLTTQLTLPSSQVQYAEICEEDLKGKRIDYLGPRGPSELLFPDANAAYIGTVQSRFPGNRFEIKWDHQTASTLQSEDSIQFRE